MSTANVCRPNEESLKPGYDEHIIPASIRSKALISISDPQVPVFLAFSDVVQHSDTQFYSRHLRINSYYLQYGEAQGFYISPKL